MLAGLQIRLMIFGGVALMIWALLTSNRKLRDKANELQDYRATVQRAKKADVSTGNVDDDREWLRDRGRKR